MSNRLSGRNPLAYLGVEAQTPPNMITSPVSPTAESRNANVGDYWLNTTNSNLYILASLSDMAATWVLIHSTVSSTNFVTNSGTAIPAANIINLLGGTGISTSALGNTINVILSTPVSISNGGTNATNMANSNGVVYFNGTSLVTTTVGSAGQVLTSQGVGMPPIFAALPIPSFVDVTGTSQAMVSNTIYMADNAGLVTLTLPASATQGTIIRVLGNGAGGWTIAQNGGQSINIGSDSTTVGVGGSLASTQRYDAIEILCSVANTRWNVISSQGNITVV